MLGRVDESLGDVLKPEPGDKARLQNRPQPAELADAVRNQFYVGPLTFLETASLLPARLEKPDGGRLEMVWRYEQYFYESLGERFHDARRHVRIDPRGHSSVKSASVGAWQNTNRRRGARSRACFV